MLALLREDEVAVGDHVELRPRALDGPGVVAVLLQLSSEAHGPLVVAASDGAVEDLDPGQREDVTQWTSGRRGAGPPARVTRPPNGGYREADLAFEVAFLVARFVSA